VKLTFLGTGTSYVVPYIGCDCEVCRSTDPRDNRLRCSITIDYHDTRLLVDTGPDFRQQCLRSGITRVSAVLWTHLHNDHIIGLDDIRPLTDRQGYIPGYADAATMTRLQTIFEYIFIQDRNHGGFPRMTPYVIPPYETFKLGGVAVTPLPIMHGQRTIFAYEFAAGGRRAVYATDCSAIPPASMDRMRGCDVFIVDALRPTPHMNHFSVNQALEAVEQVNPGRAYFTHITHELAHAETEATLPARVRLAYDGLSFGV